MSDQAMNTRGDLLAFCRTCGTVLKPPAPNQVYVEVREAGDLLRLAGALRSCNYYLVTLAGADERELTTDRCLTLTYVFSHPSSDLFLFVQTPIPAAGLRHAAYSFDSLFGFFPAVDPFERQLADMLGLYACEAGSPRVKAGSWLHPECYPADFYPLRLMDPEAWQGLSSFQPAAEHGEDLPKPGEGEWLAPAGPVHAGVIEPGRFLFRLSGEVVETVDVRLGYTHKGIEHLFQTRHNLIKGGVRLAEHVAGDSCFAHSLAYCHAAEALAGAQPPVEAQLWRGFFLELERMTNHIGDCAALAHDVAFEMVASRLSMLRHRLQELSLRLGGHRLLRGLNRVGGIVLPEPISISAAATEVARVAEEFSLVAQRLARLPAFRNRLQRVGILTPGQALALGATGLVARASGVRRDVRIQHPCGVYDLCPELQELVEHGLPPRHQDGENDTPEEREASAGDCLARFLARVRETSSSARIINWILERGELKTGRTDFCAPEIRFQRENDFAFALGHAEGWRGDVIYWLMQGSPGAIFCCRVRDPSMLNWPALKAAVDRHPLEREYREQTDVRARKGGFQGQRWAEILVGDFPIVNKSFNLSYSANDL